MLKLFIFAFLLAAVFEKTQSASSESGESGESHKTTKATKSNYYRYLFANKLYVAYAVNNCSAVDFTQSSYIMPICSSQTAIEVAFYTDSGCTSQTGTTKRYNNVTTSGQQFRCNGTNSYMAVSLGVGSCDTSLYIAPEACVQQSNASVYSNFMCQSSTIKATFGLYSGSTCASSTSSYNFTSGCESAFTLSGVSIYGEISYCSVSSIKSTSGESSESSSESTSESSSESSESMPTGSSSGNKIALKNVFGIFIIIVAYVVIF